MSWSIFSDYYGNFNAYGIRQNAHLKKDDSGGEDSENRRNR